MRQSTFSQIWCRIHSAQRDQPDLRGFYLSFLPHTTLAQGTRLRLRRPSHQVFHLLGPHLPLLRACHLLGRGAGEQLSALEAGCKPVILQPRGPRDTLTLFARSPSLGGRPLRRGESHPFTCSQAAYKSGCLSPPLPATLCVFQVDCQVCWTPSAPVPGL